MSRTRKRNLIVFSFLSVIVVLACLLGYKYYNDHSGKNQKMTQNTDFGPLPPIFIYSSNDCYMTSVLNILCRLNSFEQLLKIVQQNSPFVDEKKLFGEIIDICLKNKNQTNSPMSFSPWRNGLLKFLDTSNIIRDLQNDAVEFLQHFIGQLCEFDGNFEIVRFNIANNLNAPFFLSQNFRVNSNAHVTSILLKDAISRDPDGRSHVNFQIGNYIFNKPALVFVSADVSSNNFYLPNNILNFQLCLQNDVIYNLVGIICYNGTDHYYSILITNNQDIYKQEIGSEQLSNIKNIQNARIAIYTLNTD